MIKAVVFDVGGPLDAHDEGERLVDRHIREGLAAAGVAVTDEAYAAADRAAIASFAPNAYRAIIWTLTGGRRALAEAVFASLVAREEERSRARGGMEVRPGADAMLARLVARGLRLGLAANQSRVGLAELEACGLLRHFTHRDVSGTHGLRKPDVRVFLHACDTLGVAPAEALMVGDRIDTDIAPARALGMRTIRFRAGRHAAQEPRAWDELPDREVRSIEALEAAIAAEVSSGR